MSLQDLLQPASCRSLTEEALEAENALYDALILNTSFRTCDIGAASVLKHDDPYIVRTKELTDRCAEKIKTGGIIFVYGLSNYLALLAAHLEMRGFVFKYWIACEYKPRQQHHSLPTAHLGLLMFQKTDNPKKAYPFELNTKYVRIPYRDCPHCGNSQKDWGGKKHLLNPIGTALSDVWDFSDIDIHTCNIIPQPVLERILLLLNKDKQALSVRQTQATYRPASTREDTGNRRRIAHENADRIIAGDCLKAMHDMQAEHPEGLFDLVFADPPYNLAKNYSTYDDVQSDSEYIDWCNRWLQGMADNLRPGGALLVLNIPKWAIHHFSYLCDKLVFRNWIVWDALSTPAGKLLPAHYSLLYFTKEGGPATNHIAEHASITSREYCLRQRCVRDRELHGDNKTEPLTDVWRDIHRIKHRKDRDAHPCQLPEKLMNRIISLFTDEGDIVYDPFGGAGTTAISAKLLGRHFIISELDKEYVRIAKANLEKVHEDNCGQLHYDRVSVSKPPKRGVAKKLFELDYISLCEREGKALNEAELEAADPALFGMLAEYSGNFRKLMTFVKRTFASRTLLK